MARLNIDILYLIFEELQDDKNTLFSCILVNKTWCEITIPILWKNPWKSLKNKKEKLLLNVIISHLKKKLRGRELSYQKLSFDYISFCRHLNFSKIQIIINEVCKKSKVSIDQDEIFNLFINGNR